jgi:hypothetical protein
VRFVPRVVLLAHGRHSAHPPCAIDRYALGIYLLNLLIAFLSPKIDPALAQYEDEEESEDPMGKCALAHTHGGEWWQ